MTINTNAITPDMDDTEYFALPSLDQSQLKQYLHSRFDWAWHRLNPTYESTPAMRFGTAFHAYLLNTANVVALPEGETFRSRENRQWRDKQLEAGNIIVAADELALMERMKANLHASSSKEGAPDYERIIKEGTREQCIEWTDTKSGIRLKAKPDLIPAGEGYLVDLKTCQSIDANEFSRSAFNHGYHIQAEFYRMAVSQIDPERFGRERRRATGMQFWCFEKTASARWMPYVINTTTKIAAKARASIRNGLTRLSADVVEAQDAGYGEGLDAAARMILDRDYPTRAVPLEFPDWMLRQADRQV